MVRCVLWSQQLFMFAQALMQKIKLHLLRGHQYHERGLWSKFLNVQVEQTVHFQA